jgi:hypothetical protein
MLQHTAAQQHVALHVARRALHSDAIARATSHRSPPPAGRRSVATETDLLAVLTSLDGVYIRGSFFHGQEVPRPACAPARPHGAACAWRTRPRARGCLCVCGRA